MLIFQHPIGLLAEQKEPDNQHEVTNCDHLVNLLFGQLESEEGMGLLQRFVYAYRRNSKLAAYLFAQQIINVVVYRDDCCDTCCMIANLRMTTFLSASRVAAVNPEML